MQDETELSEFVFSPYSYSKISTFQQCKRKFKYNYIDKIPQGDRDTTPLIKGGAVHSIFEKYPEASTHKRAPDYQYIFDVFLNSGLGKKYIFRESSREKTIRINKNFEADDNATKEETLFRGFVDYICTIDDTVNLIDWKTGKLRDQKYQDFNQLLFYSIYFFLKYDHINTVRIAYVYVEHPEYENAIVLERKYLDNYIHTLKSSINDIETETVFPKNITKLCDWCPFQEHCSSDD